MKKTIGILLLAAFVALSFTACSGSGGGGGSFIDKITGKKTVDYSLANKNFGYKSNNANEEHFRFTSATTVTHVKGVSPAVTKEGTYTDPKTKTGSFTITYSDGTPALTKSFTLNDDGNNVTGMMIDGLSYSKY